tara:strand:+ start:2226 stop:2630 length:405 start_codon:yes stop_codon:yes gene_type:complete
MHNTIYFPYQVKESDIKELVNGIITLGDFHTHSQPSTLKRNLEYTGTRYGPICQNEETEIYDDIVIFNIEDERIKTAIMNSGSSGDFSITIDISTCPTNRSLIYFTFQRWKDYIKMLSFQKRDVNTTPHKKQKY